MIIELGFLIALIFLIAILFYKQRHKELQILQLEESQIASQLTDLLAEQQPIVIRGVQAPKGLTREGLAKIPRLADLPVGGQPLSSILAQPAILSSSAGLPTLTTEQREAFAEELSMPIWATHAWLPHLSQATLTGPLVGTLRTEAVLGGLGLWKTTAVYTMILPTEGTYTLSILSADSEHFLPKRWQYRYLSSLTPNDTPLVADIKFMDIVVRPGTALLIPPHRMISMEPKEPSTFSAAMIIEYHEPISLLAKSVS